MIPPRIYKPRKNELIYHYCSADTFNAICSQKTIRLCDIFSMNDFLEMHWGYSIWERVANELITEIGYEFIDSIDKIIHYSGMNCLVLASCFSLDGDVLSQWRAYADDGQGYVIGFEAKQLLKLNVKPLKIQYTEKKQLQEIKAFVLALFEVENRLEESEKFGSNFIDTCSIFSFDLASYKNPAFIEEKEVRLVHLLNFKESNNFLKLADPGGTYFGNLVTGQKVNFMMYNNAPKTFLDINFTNNNSINPIKEVIIGPKNNVLNTAISVYLETLGIANVTIKKSKASYR